MAVKSKVLRKHGKQSKHHKQGSCCNPRTRKLSDIPLHHVHQRGSWMLLFFACSTQAEATMTNFGALPSGPQTAIKPNTCDNGSWMLLFLHVLRKHVGRACVANKLRSAACRFKRACAVEGGEAIGPARA